MNLSKYLYLVYVNDVRWFYMRESEWHMVGGRTGCSWEKETSFFCGEASRLGMYRRSGKGENRLMNGGLIGVWNLEGCLGKLSDCFCSSFISHCYMDGLVFVLIPW